MNNFQVFLSTFVLFTGLTAPKAMAQIASPNVIITEVAGQNVYQGDGGYDQIDYTGRSSEYEFLRNADWSVSITRPSGNVDRLIDIDGLWFSGEQEWYALNSLVTEGAQNQTITGSAGDYDQVDYPGRSSEYTFVRNNNLSVSVTKPNGSTDTLINIDGIWFQGEMAWYGINQLTEQQTGGRTITGTAAYDQVDYTGAAVDYTFELNDNTSITVTRPDGNIDTLIAIDGIWFQGEEAWYAIESLVSLGNRTITGTNAYDQVDYDGNRNDYIFVQNQNNSVTVTRPDGGRDTLTSIDGFWFRGEGLWYSISDIFDAGPSEIHMSFSSHMDDDIIFMNNDILDAINSGEPVTAVFFTDAGSVASTARRENGMRAAYAQMIGASDWITEIVTVNGNQIVTSYLVSQPDMRLYFLRIPNRQAEQLWDRNRNTVTTLFGETYGRQELIDTITEIMDIHNPNNIRTHARETTFLSGRDHPDHRHDAEFTWAAMRQFNGNFDIDEYIGYGVTTLPANVTGTEYDEKFSVFEAYSEFDPQALNIPVFREYLARQYYIGPDGQPTDQDWDIRDFPNLF